MPQLQLTKTRIHAGRWEGVLRAPEGPAPELELCHLGQRLEGLGLAPVEGRPGRWRLSAPIPAELLSDGVQTFVLQTPAGERIGQFTIVTGVPLEDDLRAEIDLLRAEIDLLKRAFRRHLAGSGG